MQPQTEAAPVAPAGPITLDQFAAELTAEQEGAPPIEEEEAPAEVEAEAEPEASVEEPEAEEELDLELSEDDIEEEETKEPPKPVAPMPQSWAKEDAELWASLPPAAQLKVQQREADRDRAVALSRQEVAEQNKLLQAFSARLEEIAPKAENAFKQRWANVDWKAIAAKDAEEGTNNFNLYRAQYEEEAEEVERITREQSLAANLARQKFVQAEAARLAEIAPELADPIKGQERREKVGKFLLENGVPADALANISAVELALARDAMLYREAKKNAALKTSQPKPKAAPAPAPKTISPVSGQPISPQRQLQALNQRLTKSGKLEDFVALMDAEEAVKSKRALR